MMSFKQLLEWRQREIDKALEAGDKIFLTLPESWFKNATWYCQNGHVSHRFLRSEGSDRCLACGRAVVIGPSGISEWDFGLICRATGGGKEI